MWTKYSTAPNLISAEMWKNTIESEGLPCKILPENQDILDWSENSSFVIYVPIGREHVADEIMRKI
ncbi:MAG: hypothetical protein FI681_01085 [SAR202 cluster bacterium]|jgi:hypothetical protein|nr:hypothetical protein [SAR202 cluster bacterium]|tara:strand:- start:93 stop:290 length:198 start_codon:yes stop_codon:yes gene_type:complete